MMKKLLLILCLFFLTACTTTNASFEVESYLNKFKNHEKEVITSLDELVSLESITKEQKDLYRLIMKRQYTDLEYKIEEEQYNGDEATIKALITVYDYNNSKRKAIEKIKQNPTEYDTEEKIMNEQLKEMEQEEKRVKYTLTFHLRYQDEQWILETPNTEVLEKIHGIYEYETDA